MERKVNIQDWQKVTVEDFNNFGLFPRASFDHIVADTLIPGMAYTGFTTVQNAPAVVTVGNGRLFHAGLVFYNDSEGGASLDLAIGTVVTFDRAAKTLEVNTADGTRQLFQLGEYCTINTARGVEEAVTAQAHVLKKGGLVVLYFTQEGGQKVVRAIDEISHSG